MLKCCDFIITYLLHAINLETVDNLDTYIDLTLPSRIIMHLRELIYFPSVIANLLFE